MARYHHRCESRWSTLASVVLSASLLVGFTLAGTGSAPVLFPAAPPSGGIVVDEARLIAPLDQVDLEGLAIALRSERGYPITVVTIQSLSAYGAAGYTIERYASGMLKAWPADPERQGYGLTLLVSADDRLARIELGSAWRGTHDGRVRDITDRLILPALRRGDLSKGILAGVRGLDAMGRGLRLPGEWFGLMLPEPLAFLAQPWWLIPAIVVGVVLLIGSVTPFGRRRRKRLARAAAGVIGEIEQVVRAEGRR
jgi:uncharacterized membrane protein YgcG